MTPENLADLILEELLEKARCVTMSLGDKREQMISFAHGNVAIGNPMITRQMVEEEYDKLVKGGRIKL